MKIAFFSDTFLPEINSVSVSLATLSQEFANRGHEVSIFTMEPENASEKNTIEEDITFPSIKIYRAKEFSAKMFRRGTEIIHKDFHEIIASKPDIIHVHTPFGIGRQAIKASKLLNIPIIGSHHTFYADYHQYPLKSKNFFSRFFIRKYISWFYNNCQLVIVPTRAISEDLVKSGLSAPISIIPNPIDTKKLRQSAPKDILKKKCGLPEFSLVYFGRLSYEKKINNLLKVFALLSSKYPKIKLSIIGDGPERKNLEEYAEMLNVRDRVIFFGMLNGQHFVDAIAANDIFISASDTENQPLPILEAMALGLPQIVAKSPIDEYVQHSKTGFVTKEYSFMELSKEIAKLIENSTLRNQMSENSKKEALRYDVRHIAEEYERIYMDYHKNSSTLPRPQKL